MKIGVLLDKCDTFYKVARKQEDLAILTSNIGNYVHFSNSDRFGISYHKNIHPGNPRGIYGFTLTPSKLEAIVENNHEAFYDYGTSKYIYIFSVTGNILDMDNINLEEAASKMKQFVRAKYPKGSYHATYVPTPGPYTRSGAEFLSWVNRISSDIFKNEHSGVNVLLRGMGYDAVETKNYGFGDDIASQIVVINPQVANLIAKVNNPMLSKELIKEINWYNSPAYLKELENKDKERLQRQKLQEEQVARGRQFSIENEQFYQLERTMIKEHKYDELEKARKEFKEKWKDMYQ